MQNNTLSSPGLFITGTNTGVGKTYVTALIAQQLVATGRRVGVYKPAASGCELRDGQWVSEDAEQLWRAAGKPKTLEAVAPQRFAAAVAPNVAARLEGKRVDSPLLREGLQTWRDYDVTLVEGVGGLMSPISDDDLVIDLAAEFAFPLMIVVANELGCINQTLQTIEVAQNRGLEVAGIVFNLATSVQDESCETNQKEISRWTKTPVLATVRLGATAIELAPLERWLPK